MCAAAALAGTVIVAWKHKAIVDIANALMGRNDRTPRGWPDGRFDLVWVFERDDSNWRFPPGATAPAIWRQRKLI